MNTTKCIARLRCLLVVATLALFLPSVQAATLPVITAQPVDVSASAGSTATFTVLASGSAPLAYRWRLNGVTIPGSSATLSLANVSDSQAGSYTVVVSNGAGSVTSAPPATLTVTHPPVITMQPESQVVVSGDEVFLSVLVNGATPFSYQWKKEGINMAGETTSTLDLFPTSAADAGGYAVFISNVDGSTTSSTAALTVVDPSLVTSQPITGAINTCSALSFTVLTAGSEPLSYQWLFNSNPVGTDSPTFSIPAISLGDAGTYTVVVANPSASSASASATITVQEPAPVITGCPGNIIVQTGPGRPTCDQVAGWTPPTASDNCSVASFTSNHNPGDVFVVGATTVTYTATDSSNQQSTCSFTVTVTDSTPPVVVTKDITVQLGSAGTVSIAAADVNNGSSDNCAVASMSASPNSFTCANAGANTVTLTVTDIHGNTASHTATVTVQDTTPPVVVTKNITVQLDATGHVSITGADVDNGSSDACGIASRSVSPSSFTCANIGGNTVTLTVTDIHGNAASHTATVTVEDTTPPTVVTKDITVQLDASGNVSITTANVDNGSSDACGIATRSVSPSSFTCGNIGANTVTLTVTDAHGNTASNPATVTVQDTTPPAVVFNTISVQLDATGNYSLTPADVQTVAAGSTDACGVLTQSVSPSTFSFCDVGSKAVALTVTDIHGNSATSNATITVVAPSAPPAVVYVDAAYGTSCGAVSFPNTGGIGNYYIGYNAFATIASGLNAVATNGTVNVAGGDYAESLEIDKPLSLMGPNGSINPNTQTRAAEATIRPATSNPDPYSPSSVIVIYVLADHVSIKGFTVDGDNTSLTSGVLVGAADVDAAEAVASYEGVGSIEVANNIIKKHQLHRAGFRQLQ